MSSHSLKLSAVEESEVAAHLGSGALLLTASPQLAVDWKRRLVEAGGGVVATPKVCNWSHWLRGLAGSKSDVPVLYSVLQEQQLWQRIIQDDQACSGSIARGLARHAAQAYALMREYRIDQSELSGFDEEAVAFGRWMHAMQQHDPQRVAEADLAGLLLADLSEHVNESHILLDGFDGFTPMQQAVLQALKGAGISVQSVAGDKAEVRTELVACADADSEYRYLACRIAALVGKKPDARIAIVTSNQVKDSERLRRLLDETLLPAGVAPGRMQAVNMTGAPLSDAPLIRQLTGLLQLAGKSGAPFADFSRLLFSPGLKGFDEERVPRAALDVKLREDSRHFISFRPLLASAELNEMPSLAGLLKSLLAWRQEQQSAAAWVKDVHRLLQAAGFLQAESVHRSNSEIRQLNLFREVLASLVAVDAVREKLGWGAFLSLLTSSCKEQALTLPARYPQVAVLPLSAVAGMKFDTVFAVGFDEDALPLAASPSPLLPLVVQRKYGLPAATAESAYAHSVFLWQQLQRVAPQLYVSFARRREERELNASRLISGLQPNEYQEEAAGRQGSEMESFSDSEPVPLSAREVVGGGAAIIKNQSACPFRAFATHRLNIQPLGAPEPGINAADKGSLIHLALEFIWKQLGSQQALLALDEYQIAALIESAVEHAWSQSRVNAAESARKFEAQRMTRLLHQWLELERKRPAFNVVRCEKPYRLQLPETGDIRFPVRLKADRIDRDNQGHTILIDYKTGQKQSVGKWLKTRMAEPQLPLYSVAEQLGADDAVCFARVRSGDMGFEGISGDTTGIKGVSVYKGGDEEAEEWPGLLKLWRQRINELAAEFVAGRADVAPRDAYACNYCGLEAVCRIDETGFDDDAGEEA